MSASPLWLVDPSECASEAAADMAVFGFDAAPIAPASSFRFVTASALAAAQPDASADLVSVPIHASIVLGADTPLADAIELLRHDPFSLSNKDEKLLAL